MEVFCELVKDQLKDDKYTEIKVKLLKNIYKKLDDD